MVSEKIVLCDSNVLIEFYKNNQGVVEKLKQIGQHNIAVSAITVAEVIFGARDKKELQQLQKDFSALTIFPLTETITTTFLEVLYKYVLSHRLGIPDALIAATALVHNVELYTYNQKDFKFIKGLRLFHY